MTGNLRTVQELYAAFGRRDVAGILAVLSPDVVTFRDGKITRFQEFFDPYAAGDAFRP